MNITSIEGTGILPQAEGCDIFIGQQTLPASRQFESTVNWDGPEVVVPQGPDLLLPGEITYLKRHQELFEDVWNMTEEPTQTLEPLTLRQLQQQMETQLLKEKWVYGGIIAGSLGLAAAISICLWKYRRMVFSFREHCAKGRAIADHAHDSSPGNQKDVSKFGGGGTDSEVATGGTQQAQDLGIPPGPTVFR